MNTGSPNGVVALLLATLVAAARSGGDEPYVIEADAARAEPSLVAHLAAAGDQLAHRLAWVQWWCGLDPRSLTPAELRAAVAVDAQWIRRVTLPGPGRQAWLMTCGRDLQGAQLAIDSDASGWRAFFPFSEQGAAGLLDIDQPSVPVPAERGPVPRVEDVAWAAALTRDPVELGTLTAGEPRFAAILKHAPEPELRAVADVLGAGSVPAMIPSRQVRPVVALRARVIGRRGDDLIISSELPGLSQVDRMFVIRPSGVIDALAPRIARCRAVRTWNELRDPLEPERDARRLLALLGSDLQVVAGSRGLVLAAAGVEVRIGGREEPSLTLEAGGVTLRLRDDTAATALAHRLRAVAVARLFARSDSILERKESLWIR